MTNDYALKKIENIKKYDQEADNIIISLLPKIATIEKCLPEEDMKLGVDSHIRLVSDTVAQRVIENPNIWNAFHSIMLRYSTPFYTYTEYHKILDGTFAKYYLYRWLNANGKSEAWIFFDVDKLRLTTEILECTLNPIKFKSGGSYVTIKVKDLAKNGCIIACNDVVQNYLFSELQ